MHGSITKSMVLIVMMSLFAACSTGTLSMSAPPVDLPAPITGRIDISEPDENGNANITGSAGAVPGGSLVMAVNEDIAGEVAFFKILDTLIRPAYAQAAFPPICYEMGRACAFAEEDGSFLIVIQGEADDSIVIGIIDESTGSFISEVLRRKIGDGLGGLGDNAGNEGESLDCSGLNVNGKAVDIALVPGTGIPIVLRQGSETNTNQIALGSPTPISMDIPGCFAHSIATRALPNNLIAVAVTSSNDGIIWSGVFSGTKLVQSDTFEFEVLDPLHIMFPPSGSPIVALRNSDTITLARISLVNGSITAESELVSSIAGSDGPWSAVNGLVKSTAMDNIPMDVGPPLGLLVTRGGGNFIAYFLTVFDANSLEILDTFPTSQLEASKVTDAKFYFDKVDKTVRVALVDADQDDLAVIRITSNPPGAQFSLQRNHDITANNMTNWMFVNAFTLNALDAGGNSVPIRKLQIARRRPSAALVGPLLDAIDQVAIATTTDGAVWMHSLNDDLALPGSVFDLSAGADNTASKSLIAIGIDDDSEKLFVVDAATQGAVPAEWLVW